MGRYLDLVRKVSETKSTGSPVTQETFSREFNQLASHLRNRDYSPNNFTKLQTLSLEMNAAWNRLDFHEFKKVIDEMMQIPGKLRAEGNMPVGTKIFSHILQDTVWVAIDPIFQANDGIPVYYPEEIQNLKGATPDEVQAVHRVKKEFGGKLIAVNQRGEG
jgi:hypothetical protein